MDVRFCVFITAGFITAPSTKLFACVGEIFVNIKGHVLRETKSRGLCGLVCPSARRILFWFVAEVVCDGVCVCATALQHRRGPNEEDRPQHVPALLVIFDGSSVRWCIVQLFGPACEGLRTAVLMLC